MTTACPARTSSLMDDLLGLLRIRIKRGVNLAVRDISSSDPYVVVKMGKQVYLFPKKLQFSQRSLHQKHSQIIIY